MKQPRRSIVVGNPCRQVQHAVQGWCLPLPVLRALGVRTRKEIDIEKYALKALRGDFRNASHRATRALAATLA